MVVCRWLCVLGLLLFSQCMGLFVCGGDSVGVVVFSCSVVWSRLSFCRLVGCLCWNGVIVLCMFSVMVVNSSWLWQVSWFLVMCSDEGNICVGLLCSWWEKLMLVFVCLLKFRVNQCMWCSELVCRLCRFIVYVCGDQGGGCCLWLVCIMCMWIVLVCMFMKFNWCCSNGSRVMCLYVLWLVIDYCFQCVCFVRVG